jgi:NAD-dependent dihydropyrimidine dehydrogenase PreA subunit
LRRDVGRQRLGRVINAFDDILVALARDSLDLASEERVTSKRDTGMPMGWFTSDREKYATLASAWVLPEPKRCVQCGVCSFNCPMTIDVRRHVWLREPVVDSRCLTCGECVKRCPRGLLRFEPITDTVSASRAKEAR